MENKGNDGGCDLIRGVGLDGEESPPEAARRRFDGGRREADGGAPT